jgi:hypothetical protein
MFITGSGVDEMRQGLSSPISFFIWNLLRPRPIAQGPCVNVGNLILKNDHSTLLFMPPDAENEIKRDREMAKQSKHSWCASSCGKNEDLINISIQLYPHSTPSHQNSQFENIETSRKIEKYSVKTISINLKL